jgi:hypothetical protein
MKKGKEDFKNKKGNIRSGDKKNCKDDGKVKKGSVCVQAGIEEDMKIRTLKEEMKILDSLYTILLQSAYSVKLLDTSLSTQSLQSEGEIYDRGKQLIDLKKQVSSLKLESSSRLKTKLLDDILSQEYSLLSPCDSEILSSISMLSELQVNCSTFLNRVDLDRGVIISPKDLEDQLKSSALELNSLTHLVQDEAEDIQDLSKEFSEILQVIRSQHETLEDIQNLQKQIDEQKMIEKVQTIQQVLPKRLKLLQALVMEDF